MPSRGATKQRVTYLNIEKKVNEELASKCEKQPASSIVEVLSKANVKAYVYE